MSDQLFPSEQLLRNKRGRVYAKVLTTGEVLYACANSECDAEFKQRREFPDRIERSGRRTGRPASYCQSCENKRAETRRKTDIDKVRESSRESHRRLRMTVDGRSKVLVRSARNRAQKSSGRITCTLTYEWCLERLVAGKCEATGAPLVFDWERKIVDGRAWTHPFAPSIDRKDPKGDYSPGNCQVVCWIYNRCKADCTHADIVVMARFLLKHDGPAIAALN